MSAPHADEATSFYGHCIEQDHPRTAPSPARIMSGIMAIGSVCADDTCTGQSKMTGADDDDPAAASATSRIEVIAMT
jgi:hypothetical protein